jgi:polar amino acid transport system substrate-binding protein
VNNLQMKDIWRALFPQKWHRAAALFVASLLVIAGIAACSSQPADFKSLVNISTADVATATIDPGATMAEIQRSGKVRIAIPDDFTPFGSIGPDMKHRGYDVDVAGDIAKGLNVALETVPVVGNYRIPFLQTNRVDLVISSLGKNKDRAKIIDFSDPYAPFFSGIYGRSTIKVSQMSDLKGHIVGVAQGSLEDLELSKQDFSSQIMIKRFANNSLTASSLISGQTELIATGNVVAAQLIRDNPDQGIKNQFIMKNSPCYVGVRKGDTDLLKRVNTIISELKRSGQLNQLSLKWFKEPLPDLTPPTA